MSYSTAWDNYRDRVEREGVRQLRDAAPVWRECGNCKRNTRHVKGTCQECGEVRCETK